MSIDFCANTRSHEVDPTMYENAKQYHQFTVYTVPLFSMVSMLPPKEKPLQPRKANITRNILLLFS